jgi:hypothetical protein
MTVSKLLTSILARGAILGALTGFSVSALYAVLLIGFFLAMSFFGALVALPTHPNDAAMMLLVGPASAGFMFICASFIGVLPGTILGTVIGLLISLPVGLLRSRLTPGGAAVVGVLVSTGIIVLIHGLLLSYDPDPTLREYLLLTILPGVLCMAAGGWVGWRLQNSIL